MENNAVAQVPQSENDMKVSYELVESNANNLSIANEEQYAEAAEFARLVKTRQKEVKEYFAPMKENAHKAHAAICEREKQMLAPLLKAEKKVKEAMTGYANRLREEARKQEELMRKLAQQEAERKLAEAIELEKTGDSTGAEAAIAEAGVAERFGNSPVIQSGIQAPKVSGVSTIKDYEIVSVSADEVPVSFGGVEIRPVDTKAVMRLIKESGGTVSIPGIQYRETTRLSVSSRR